MGKGWRLEVGGARVKFWYLISDYRKSRSSPRLAMAAPSHPLRQQIVKFGCHDTRRNLPAISSSKRGESNFLAKFEKAFLAAELKKGNPHKGVATGREFALEGFGRADVLFMAWNSTAGAEDFTAMALK